MFQDPTLSTAWLAAHLEDPGLVVIDATWFAAHLEDPGLVIIDATWFMPGTPRDARAEHAEKHIPGAVFFDIDEVSDHTIPLPHMLAAPSDFAVHVRRLGGEPDSRVVVYDGQGLFSAPRVWWNFRAMGHENVFVLDGGLPKWITEDHPVESGWPQRPHGEFKAHRRADLVRDIDLVRAALAGGTEQLVDARPAARFTGEAPEPRPGLRGGHMPGARSVPSASVITPEGTLKDAAALERLFADAGVSLGQPITTTCGSGVSAAILALALARLGRLDVAVYDGSWSEWGARHDTPVVTGPATP
jgi:thiosulfate/3-mercaptopyruvate sulfurtransferase